MQASPTSSSRRPSDGSVNSGDPTPSNTTSRPSSSAAISASPPANLTKELPLAIQALKYAEICYHKYKAHTQLSILSVWPFLIQHIWRQVYTPKDLAWSPKTSIDEQETLWARASYKKNSIDDELFNYYIILVNKTAELPSKVCNGLYANKEGFKKYLTDLLNTWETLARLAIYDSIANYNAPLPSPLSEKEDEPIFKAWGKIKGHIEVWNVRHGRRPGLSLKGLLAAERENCFSIRLEGHCFLFTMHNPRREMEKTVWRWSFPALRCAEFFTQRSEVLGKVKSVIKLIDGDVNDATKAYGQTLLTQDRSLSFIRKPYILNEVSNWKLGRRSVPLRYKAT